MTDAKLAHFDAAHQHTKDAIVRLRKKKILQHLLSVNQFNKINVIPVR